MSNESSSKIEGQYLKREKEKKFKKILKMIFLKAILPSYKLNHIVVALLYMKFIMCLASHATCVMLKN